MKKKLVETLICEYCEHFNVHPAAFKGLGLCEKHGIHLHKHKSFCDDWYANWVLTSRVMVSLKKSKTALDREYVQI